MKLLYDLIKRCCGHVSSKPNEYDSTCDKVVLDAETLKSQPRDEVKSQENECLEEIFSKREARDSHAMPLSSTSMKSEEIKSTKDDLMRLVENEFPNRIVKKKSRSMGHTLDAIPKITLSGPEEDSSTKTLFKVEPTKKGKRGKGKKKEKPRRKKTGLE